MRYIVPIVIIVLALLGASSIYVVDQGHAAVLTRFGRVKSADVGPGLHFKLPVAGHVTVYDTRAIVTRSQPEDYKTADGDQVRVGYFVRWRVADPGTFFKATSGDELQVTQQMAPVIQAALRTQIGQHSLADLLGSDGGVIDRALSAAVSGPLRQKLGVAILAIGVERVLPPDSTLASIYKRMKAEAGARANEVRARGQAAAAALRAKGADANRQVLAAAEKKAAAVRGEGDAKAAKIYAAAAHGNPQFFRYWSTLETWRDTFDGGGAVVVLDRHSPFMEAISRGVIDGSVAKKPSK